MTLMVSLGQEEATVGAFWETGCLGVEVAGWRPRSPSTRIALRAFYPDGTGESSLSGRVTAALRSAGVRLRGRPRIERRSEKPWLEIFRRSLKPMRIGRLLLIVPHGCRSSESGSRRSVRIRFGQAFGTGEHASTRLALRLLESTLQAGERVLDLGTGTGILSIAAIRLGASYAVAVDEDAAALRVARANVADNGLRGRIELIRRDAGRACGHGSFDVLVVNIGPTVIGRILPVIAGALKQSGRAVLAGILREHEKPLLDAMRPLGLHLLKRCRSGPWSALLVARDTRSSRACHAQTGRLYSASTLPVGVHQKVHRPTRREKTR